MSYTTQVYYITILYTSLMLTTTIQAKCDKVYPKLPTIKQKNVYQNMPFQPGEQSIYKVYYYGIFVGSGLLEVRAAKIHDNSWLRYFYAKAKTGKWYNLIFEAEDKVLSLSQPQDFAVRFFSINQNEKALFKKRNITNKYLEFFPLECLVKETIVQKTPPHKKQEFKLSYGATDTLSIVYLLRSETYQLGKTKRFLVYSSQKNWWLTATAIAFEQLNVDAGKFHTVKLKLTSYIGKALQQQGKVHVWFATKHANRPLVKISGRIKLGKVNFELSQFIPGTKNLTTDVNPKK